MRKEGFKQPVVEITKAGEVLEARSSQASCEVYSETLAHISLRLCSEAEMHTLHRAVTTADGLRSWIQTRGDSTTFADVQVIVLEGFIWQSQAKTRVITSLGWLCENLGLAWPLDKLEKPVVGKVGSALGMEAKQTPAAQPMMFNHLEDAMKTKCEEKDPTWTALLTNFLHAARCLRLGHIIRRSVPVERYDGWHLFFCKRGKQKHNRQGFYWGVPSYTSSSWDWASPFLELYLKKRASDKEGALMRQ